MLFRISLVVTRDVLEGKFRKRTWALQGVSSCVLKQALKSECRVTRAQVLSFSICRTPALSRAANLTSTRAGLWAHADGMQPLFISSVRPRKRSRNPFAFICAFNANVQSCKATEGFIGRTARKAVALLGTELCTQSARWHGETFPQAPAHTETCTGVHEFRSAAFKIWLSSTDSSFL